MPLIKENNKNTGYSYDIVTDCDDIKSKCGITVMITNISTKATLHYDLTDGKLVAGKDIATEDDRDFADYCTQLYLREWQAKAGLRYLVRFTTESDCYYDFSEEKLYNATGKKRGKPIGGKPVKFTPTEQGIFSRLVNMAGYLCEYQDISLALTGDEEALSSKNIHVRINSIRNYDDIAIRPFIAEGNKGYTYIGRKAEWVLDKADNSQKAKRVGVSLIETGSQHLRDELIETELSDVKAKLADLVESLMKQDDIFPQLQGIVALCRRLNLQQSKEFVLKKIQTCKKLAEKSGQYDDRTLSFLEYLEDYISVHVRLTEILREIGQNNEELFAARTIERRQRLSRTNFDLQQHYSKELTALMEYDQELEKIQSNGISKDSMLSLSKPYFSNDP